jgi:hypothetical protein
MTQLQRNFSLYATLFLLSVSSYGQKFSLGIKAGGSVNWAAIGEKAQKDTFSSKPVIGYTVGFQVGFPLKKNFQFVAEGAYSKKGRILTFNKDLWENHSVYRFAEGTMLLRKRYKFHLKKNIPSEWIFSLGPEVSYLIDADGKIIIDGNKPGYDYNVVFDKTPDSNYRNMYYNDINRWLFGLVLGAGFEAPLRKNQRIAVELRFISGHTFLGKRKSSYIEILGFQDTMITNLKSFNFSAIYSFNFDVQQSRKGKSTLDKTIKKKH